MGITIKTNNSNLFKNYLRVCRECGISFSGRINQKYCINCKYSSKKCSYCDCDFKIGRYTSMKEWKEQKYCCRECADKSLMGRKNDKGTFKKGMTPWIKGKKFDYKPRPKQIGKTAGEKNNNWKGGITPKNKLERAKFINSIQKQVLKRDDYTCQICGKRGGNLNVDHIQPWSKYVEGRFCIDNCRTLCIACHYQITFNKPMPSNSKWGYIGSAYYGVANKFA
jgi:hypothetical protein